MYEQTLTINEHLDLSQLRRRMMVTLVDIIMANTYCPAASAQSVTPHACRIISAKYSSSSIDACNPQHTLSIGPSLVLCGEG